MKFQVTIESGAATANHTVEIPARSPAATSGCGEFKLDGVAQEFDWAEVEPGVYSLVVGSKSYVVSAWSKAAGASSSSSVYQVSVGAHALRAEVRDARASRRPAATRDDPLEIVAPMPGRIVKILAPEGAVVAGGHGVLVIEAMKMQNEIRAPRAGEVRKVHVREGEGVEAGARLISIL